MLKRCVRYLVSSLNHVYFQSLCTLSWHPQSILQFAVHLRISYFGFRIRNFYFVNIKGFQVYSTLSLLRKKGQKQKKKKSYEYEANCIRDR